MRVCGRIKAARRQFAGRSVCRRKRSLTSRAVFVIIGDFQPFAFSSCPCCKDMPLQRNTSASFSRSAAFNISSGSTRMVSHSRQRRAAISFSALHWAILKRKQSHTVRDVRRHLQTIPDSDDPGDSINVQSAVVFPQRCWQNRRQGRKHCTGTLSLLPFGVPTSGA